MSSEKSFKPEWLIIILLIIVIIIGGIYMLSNKNDDLPVENQTTDSSSVENHSEQNELIKKYEKLELAYNSTINEIETVIEDDNMNLNILRENLSQILTSIKEEKLKINQGDSISVSGNIQQLEDMLTMSKEVLAERLLEEKTKNEKLTIDNRKLHYNLKKSMDHFEKEKTKNVKLNAEVLQIKTKIKNLEQEGTSAAK